MRESEVEKKLVEAVEDVGGECEKFSSPNRRNVPDRLVTWPAGLVSAKASVCFVECKATGKGPTPAQRRDHERRRRMGFRVYVVDSPNAIWHFKRQEGL